MKYLMIALLFLSSCVAAEEKLAGELQIAYEKEYAFLTSEKNRLEKRLQNVEKEYQDKIGAAKKEIEKLQELLIQKRNSSDKMEQQIVEAEREGDVVANQDTILEATILQAKESLAKLHKTIPDSDSRTKKLEEIFAMGVDVMAGDDKITVAKQTFFMPNGDKTEGEVISVGRIAKYGISDQAAGPLAPAGDGHFKLWNTTGGASALAAKNSTGAGMIDIFLYENATKDATKKEEKTVEDVVESGGIVGYVIIFLGVLGILLVILRVLFLMFAGSKTEKLTRQINPMIEGGEIEKALEYCKKKNSSAAKVVKATIKNLHRDRNHLEDIVSEAILNENNNLDRFGTMILVIAAISPLLGLLGTVTGMISTFDIITEFGTGDPKLLSGGISEALVTTEFGLIVAIPMLLFGNLLSGWAENIKHDMEKAALHIINLHKKD